MVTRKKKIEQTNKNTSFPKCEIFITYRFAEGKIYATCLYDRLKKDGYWVYLAPDNPDCAETDFMFSCLDHAIDFLVVLPPHALDFGESGDDTFFQKQLEHAIQANLNIIPIELENFEWPDAKNLPESFRDFLEFQSIPLNPLLFDQAEITLTKNRGNSQKKFLQAKKHINRKISRTLSISVPLAIFLAFLTCYLMSLPVLYLDVADHTQLQNTLNSRYKHWNKYYAVTNSGGKTGSIHIEPTAAIEIIVYSETEGSSGRMGSITIGFKNDFNQNYQIKGKPSSAVAIPDTNAHLIAEYLSEAAASLQKRNLVLCMYAVKMHFFITYKDLFGIEHHEILEPDFNYDFSFVAPDKESDGYLLPRSFMNKTLYKRKSAAEPDIIVELMEDGQMEPKADQLAQSIDHNKKQLFDKDCGIRKNDSKTNRMNAYYTFFKKRIEKNKTVTEQLHVQHDDCAIMKNY